ncbi:hypothetical protein [Halodesulfovibrio sp.]|jgi:type II secretory pathway component PulJ|uniref:PulJ/GspJ family protein n=1 Tax=Halodesulfovibrio sp. TaxID=1912772 RepID=UPI0025F7DD3A|nr:hypothetical protein [Halodesulfovibrio sp.]MCT4625425.1 hypothetical protein [Halodesulfovibrio sp.]
MTLLEQLVSLMICAILIVAAVGSYRTSISGSDILTKRAGIDDVTRHVLDIISEDLLLAYTGHEDCKLKSSVVRSGGNEDVVLQLCTTANPLEDDYSAIQQVKYVLRSHEVAGNRQRQLLRISRAFRTSQTYDWESLLLVGDVRSLKFTDVPALSIMQVSLAVRGREQKSSVSKAVSYSYAVPEMKNADSGA